jgi:hypothetical protein
MHVAADRSSGNTACMLRGHTQSRFLIALLCIFVVTMRIGGAHVHFCFDGSEPPATLHMSSDEGSHHEDEAAHTDMDVSLSGDTLIKKFESSIQPLLLLAVAILFIRFTPVLTISRTRFNSLPRLLSQFAFQRPLLRGPPL